MSAAVMAFIAATVLLIIPAAAQAAPQCNRRAVILAHLADQYAETPVAAGLSSSGFLVELLTAADGSTWTLIGTRPQNRAGVRWTCLLASGEAWRDLRRRPPGAPS
jgi:hypothetical protein